MSSKAEEEDYHAKMEELVNEFPEDQDPRFKKLLEGHVSVQNEHIAKMEAVLEKMNKPGITEKEHEKLRTQLSVLIAELGQINARQNQEADDYKNGGGKKHKKTANKSKRRKAITRRRKQKSKRTKKYTRV